MSNLREEFEKLPSIAKYLPCVFFNDETEGYCNKSDNPVPFDFASFLNGGWMAFQEQQKKLDAIIECVKNNTADYELDRKIQELLK